MRTVSELWTACQRVLWVGAGAALVCAGPSVAVASTPTVFACEPEWAALVQVLMPEARVHVATHARQDPHHIEARPALIAQLRSADLAVCTGAALEAGWLPMLKQRAANAAVQDGKPGMFYAADHVKLIDPRPATLNPFAGDVHPEGNPHLHADPQRLAQVTKALAERLALLWPARATNVMAKHASWEAVWQRKVMQWQQQAQELKGKKVAAQHTTFGYLWHWLGMEMVADLEPKPGMPPTPGHLDALRQTLTAQPPMAIVVAAYQDDRSAQWLARQLREKSTLLVLQATVPDPAQPQALELWFDQLLTQLLTASGKR